MPQIAPLLGSVALNLAIGFGASVLSSIIRPQQKTARQQATTSRGLTFEMEVGEAVSVSAIVGLGRAAGQLMYMNEYGDNNEFVQFVVKAGHGWHDGMDAFLVDEKPEAMSGSNADPRGRSVTRFTVGGVPYMWVKYYTGAPGQAADPELIAQARPAGRWTANHKMTGCAYMVITIRYHEDLYGQSIPLFGSVWRGLKLFDWRVPGAVWGDQSTYVFTKNPAVIRYNFRRGIWVNGVRILGQGFGAFANDLAGYTAAANRCDETFFDPVSGRIFTVFEYGRSISDDESKLSILQELDDSYCGSSFKRGGADVPLPAQQLVPVMTLTDGDRLSGHPIRVDRKGSRSTKKTMWHGQFVSADAGWGEAPFTARIDTALENLIGGRRAETMNQPYENLQERAQLRAEVALRRQFYPATRVETFVPMALVLEPGDPVLRVSEWGSMMMVVEKAERLADMTGVTLTLTEFNNTIVPASGDSFIVLPTGPGAGPANPDRTIAVSAFGIASYQRAGGGAVHPFGRATWAQITDPNVEQVMIRVWPVGGDEQDDGETYFADARLQTAKLVGPLQPLTTYNYWAIPIRKDARTCVRTNPATFTTGAETTPAEVADGSIDAAKLAQELQNERGYLVGNGEGTLDQLLTEYQERQAAAELAALTDQATRYESFKLLKAKSTKALAAITETRRVIAEENAALAELIDEVAVELAGDLDDLSDSLDDLADEITENLTAGGLFQISAEVGPGGASAEILLKVRAAVAQAFAEAAIRLKAEAQPGGGVLAYVDIMADRLRFVSTNGSIVTIPFKIETIAGVPTVVVQAMRFREFRSLDGTSLIINGSDPEINLIG